MGLNPLGMNDPDAPGIPWGAEWSRGNCGDWTDGPGIPVEFPLVGAIELGVLDDLVGTSPVNGPGNFGD